jgi:nicotinamide-nucleotide amidase
MLNGPPSIALVPGVPAEMVAMVTEELLPRLRLLHATAAPLRKVFRIAGLFESQVEALLAPVIERMKALEGEQAMSAIGRTILASPGDVAFILRGSATSRPLLDRAGSEIAAALGDALYSTDDEGIEVVVARKLSGASLTLATAESCTAGMLGALITSVPGASVFYRGGVVAYSDEIKREWLGVPAGTIAEHGAVSEETAIAMARGARERARADLALAITGIAGPGGGSPGKPVGLVHIALATSSGVTARRLDLPGDRESIRLRSCRAALDLLRHDLIRSERERQG